MSTTLLRLSGRLVRWGFFAVAVVLGLTLLISAFSSYWDTRAQVDTLIRGQSATLIRKAQAAAHDGTGPPTDAKLQAFLDEHYDEGVRYVAIFGPRGRFAAGTPVGSVSWPRGEGYVLLEDRVQTWFARFGPEGPGQHGDTKPPWPPGKHGDLEPPWPPQKRGDGKLPPPPPGTAPTVLEFIPQTALDLQARTTRDLWVGITVALALVLAATVLWRLSSRAQAVQAHLARQRHLAALGEMSAVLAHEIRNPLAALKGHAQLLAERVQGNEVLERKTARIVDASERLETLTRSLLDFARISAVTRTPVDPVKLLRRCADGCSAEVTIDSDDAPSTWPLGATRIEQVLSNLLDNAAQANKVLTPDARVEARVVEDDGMLVFEVRDHGPGVPAQERERIFEPFVTGRTRGTGLGLAVSRRIVELHGGTIEVLDAAGGGALFRVSLPPHHSE